MKSEENKGSDFELIKLDNICRNFGFGDAESFALKNFSLTVKRGEFIMIMGPSGCGKTTLLNILGLLDKPTSGTYYLNGKKVNRLTSRGKSRIRAKQIGFIFQDFNLIPNLTVIENVALPLVYSGATKTHRLIQASDTLGRFHLSEREYFYPAQLSGGQKQRVAIARSLVTNPEIILADEPTGNLDSRSSHIVMEELRRIHSEGNTIIMVTHNPNLTTYATRVIHMLDGNIDEDIKTVSDNDLPVPINERIEQSDYNNISANEISLEADTEKFEQRKNLIRNRLTLQDQDKSTKKTAQKPEKTTEKTPEKAAEEAQKPAPKPVQRTVRSTKKAKHSNLHYTGDPGFRIKERPTIEDLIKENK